MRTFFKFSAVGVITGGEDFTYGQQGKTGYRFTLEVEDPKNLGKHEHRIGVYGRTADTCRGIPVGSLVSLDGTIEPNIYKTRDGREFYNPRLWDIEVKALHAQDGNAAHTPAPPDAATGPVPGDSPF